MRLRRLPILGVFLAAASLAAQEPAFDVASIRPTRSEQRSEIQPTPFGRFTATNATPRSLILRAYGLVDTQLIGAPAWLNTERYDLDARTAARAGGPEALMPLVRTLLVERFKLQARSDTRELQAFAITFARRDRQPGPQLRPSQADCSRPTTLTPDEVRAAARDGWPPCGMAYFVSFVTGPASGNLVKMVRRTGITMAALATALQPIVDRPVVDQTGLAGSFDVEYSYAPPSSTAGPSDPAFGPEAPILSVALEEQLGLKLESRRMSVPVLVVDSIDRPTEN